MRKPFLRVKACFLLLLHSLSAPGQDTLYYTGKLCDSESAAPVMHARLTVKGGFRGTLANEKGEFTLALKKTKSVVEITAPGYFPAFISTPFLIKPDYKVQMKALPVVPAPGISWEKVFRPGKWDILDFDFCGGGIVLLAREKPGTQHTILYISFSGHLVFSRAVPDELLGFYTDSNRKKYILGTGKARGCSAAGKSGIQLDEEIALPDFEKQKYAWPYADSAGRYLRFEAPDEYYLDNSLDLMLRQQALTLYIVGRKDGRRSLFKNFADEKFGKPAEEWKKYAELDLPRVPFSSGPVLYHRIPVQVLQAGNHIAIFDLQNRRIEVFDSTGRPASSASFYPGKGQAAEARVFTDDETGKVYYCALRTDETGEEKPRNYYTSLSEINPLNGRVNFRLKLEPEAYYSLKVREGHAYYLKRESNSPEVFFLARSRF